MSGRWQWVPVGWQVVPCNPDDRQMMHGEEALEEDQPVAEMYRRMLRTAPAPTESGWKQGYPESGTFWHAVPSGARAAVALGWWDRATNVAWHTPIPPLPPRPIL